MVNVSLHTGYRLFTFVEMFAEGEALFIGSRLQLDCHISVFCRPTAGDTEQIRWLLSGPAESWGLPCTFWESHPRAWQQQLSPRLFL